MSKSGPTIHMRKPILFLTLALIISMAIYHVSKPVSYVEQLIRLQAEQVLGSIDNRILNEPLEVQALLLDYSGDKANSKELVLKAWIALSKYPAETREILSLYGSEPEFREILQKYGDPIIPVVQYFRDNNVWSVSVTNAAGNAIRSATGYMKGLWGKITGNAQTNPAPFAQPQPVKLGPTERGWYAVKFIQQEGQSFLSEFIVGQDKKAKWNQTARITNGLTSLFTSGVRNLETKYDLGDVKAGDWFWAGVDVAVVAVPLKLFRAGKLVERTGEQLSVTARTRVFAPRLLAREKVFQRWGKYGVMAATAYIVVAHPSLVNSLLAEVAKLMGLSPWIVQGVGWFLIATIALYLLSWILKPLARFILFGLSWLDQSRKQLLGT